MITLLTVLGLAAFIRVFATLAGVLMALAFIFAVLYGAIECIKQGKWWLLIIFLILLL